MGKCCICGTNPTNKDNMDLYWSKTGVYTKMCDDCEDYFFTLTSKRKTQDEKDFARKYLLEKVDEIECEEVRAAALDIIG